MAPQFGSLDRGPTGRWPMRIYTQAVGPGLRDGAPLALSEERVYFNSLLKLREAVENGLEPPSAS